MANTPVYVPAPPEQTGLTLKLVPLPTVMFPDPAGSFDYSLTELTAIKGMYTAIATDALNGSFLGSVVSASGKTLVTEIALQMVDDEEPIFPAQLFPSVEIKRGIERPNFKFLMVLEGDGKTPAPGLTITSQRSKDAETSFSLTDNNATEIGNGWYVLNLTANDMNAKSIAFRFSAATALDRNITLVTQP